MSTDLVFDLDFPPESGSCTQVSPLLRRMVAGNKGPFTFTGTCSYIVGRGQVAIVDPGPDEPEHIAALLAALRGETVTHVVVTHTHLDQSPAARAIAAATGAPIVGCGPHRRARALNAGETGSLERSNDILHAPDLEMREGDAVSGPGWTLTALATPGHTANHLAFTLAEENAILSGDHVMAWSTTFIGPPDGSMTDYMASLEKLKGRGETVYWPGHGGPVKEPQRFLRGLIHHRRQREASILTRLDAGDRTIATMVGTIYRDLAPALVPAAALSIFAHLEDLVGRGVVASEGPPRPDSEYWLAS
jgi:glyoxylase-like metal-dependent hydrolase (beta-lactamase superfamily II)